MLGKKPKLTKIQELEKRSEDAISVFKTTLNSLTTIEQEADKEIEAKNAQIMSIQTDITKINDRKEANSKFIKKLNEFFE